MMPQAEAPNSTDFIFMLVQVTKEIESTHDYDGNFICVHPLNKSTQVL